MNTFSKLMETKCYEGWMDFYKPYINNTGLELPELQEADILRNVVIIMNKKYTPPPPRFNQASLLEKMEKEKIGTKTLGLRLLARSLKETILLIQTPTVLGEAEFRLPRSDLK